MIKIRPVDTTQEFRVIEKMQQEIWQINDDVDVVPHNILVAIRRNGGVVLGVFDDEVDEPKGKMIGFVFGFLGMTEEGKIKLYSHRAGVLPEYRGRNIGYTLKLAQRQEVIQKGVDLITWTYDPLESLNANLNFRKLGVVASQYERDMYGDMRNRLHGNMPSDRFVAEWYICSKRVEERLEGRGKVQLAQVLSQKDVVLVSARRINGHVKPPDSLPNFDCAGVVLEIPASIQAVKSDDLKLAQAWRMYTRDFFEKAFSLGYTATEMIYEGGKSYYLLRNDFQLF